jgi:hypothetical protein
MLVNSYLMAIRLKYLTATDCEFEPSSLALYGDNHVHLLKTEAVHLFFEDVDEFFEDVKRGSYSPTNGEVEAHLKTFEAKLERLEYLRKRLFGNPHMVKFLPKTGVTRKIIETYRAAA